ncbi:MAG: hypothetical protein WA628_09510 [Terriglobales bacterium]
MTLRRVGVLLAVLIASSLACAEQFAVFPDHKELRSPDGRFVIRSVDHVARPGEFTGVFRSLVLEDAATGSARGLYNYLGRVGVAWSGSNFVIITDYVSKKTARALVFRIDQPGEYLVIDKPHLAARIPDELRAQLERNDHVYLEVSRIEGTALTIRVWGYGVRDPQGFRFLCTYDLNEGATSCRASAVGAR